MNLSNLLMPSTGQLSVSSAIITLLSVSKGHDGSISSPASSYFLPFTLVYTTHHWPCEGFCLQFSLWVRGRPRISSCSWFASQPISCQRHSLVHYQFPWRRKTWAAFHFIRMPLRSEREGGEKERVRKNEGEQIANESLWVGGSISWFEENLTTEDKRLRQCLPCAYLTYH